MCYVIFSGDLAFDLYGYTFILINNVCTAANGVYTKKKLESKVNALYSTINYPPTLFTLRFLLVAIVIA